MTTEKTNEVERAIAKGRELGWNAAIEAALAIADDHRCCYCHASLIPNSTSIECEDGCKEHEEVSDFGGDPPDDTFATRIRALKVTP